MANSMIEDIGTNISDIMTTPALKEPTFRAPLDQNIQFCTDPLWDLNLTWYTEQPDFTKCFHSTVLVYVPCLFLWLLMPFKLYEWTHRNTNQPSDGASKWTWVILSRFILQVLLLILTLASLIINVDEIWSYSISEQYLKPLSEVIAPAILSLTFALCLAISITDRRNGIHSSSGMQFGFWFFLALGSTLTFTSVVRFPEERSTANNVTFWIYYFLVLIAFLLEFWPNPKSDYVSIGDDSGMMSPEVNATFISKMFFAWFDGMIWKGWKAPLKADDLYDLNPVDSSSHIIPRWEENWENQRKRKTKTVKPPGEINLSIVPTIVWSFGGTFAVASFIRFINILMQLIIPNINGYLINFVTNGEELWHGYLYMVSLVFVNLLKTITVSNYFYKAMTVGMRIRTGVTSAIYQKSLKLSNQEKKNMSVGETINLMAIDTQRFMDLAGNISQVWSSPLMIILCQYFLWQYLGPSSLAGLALMVITIPVDTVIAKKLKKLQLANMKNKDERIKIMNEILDGVKIVKLYAWEPSFVKKVVDIRDKELHTFRWIAYLQAILTFIFSATPFFVACASFACYVLVDPENNILTADKAFVSISFFNLLRMPLNSLPMLVIQLIQASVSLKRVNNYLNLKEINPKAITREKSFDTAIEMKNASFTWDTEAPPAIENISFDIPKGSLVAIVGQVGSGKSSILASLTGDLQKLGTVSKLNIDGSIAYVPQTPWLQNASLRYNITFGKAFKESTYNKVIQACALQPDLDILAGGDSTEIGEKGINLSGGQKQRVSIARSIYSNRDIYLLDDPLSAVDAKVGKHMFDNVIGPNGLLKNKTRLLVTHGVSFLPQTDMILVVKNGTISERGTYKQLLKKGGEFAEFLLEYIQQDMSNLESDAASEKNLEEIKEELENVLGTKNVEARMRKMSQSNISGMESDEDTSIKRRLSRRISQVSRKSKDAQALLSPRSGRKKDEKADFSKGRGRGGGGRHGNLMQTEVIETKSIDRQVYTYYFYSVGLPVVFLALVLQIVQQAFNLSTNIWLSKWTDDPDSLIPSVRNKYLGIYGLLGAISAIAVMFASAVTAIGGLTASGKLHNTMLSNVLHAPMSFFDTNPKGRILNRFSKDQDFVDMRIPSTISSLCRLFLQVLSTIVAISYANPIFFAVVIPLAFIYWYVQRIYVKTARQIKRLDSAARSPMYSHFSESLSGISTIRAYQLEDRFKLENEMKIDFSQKCYQPSLSSNRWLSIRLEILGNMILLFAALFAVLGRDTMDPGVVGLSLSYASSVTMSLNFLIRQSSQIETDMVSVERIKEYQENIAQEAPFKMPSQDPPSEWPEYGMIEFDNYHTRYRDGLELIIKGISCKILSGEKVGIVGRTGAGKSSLVLALFRIIEPADGCIKIDEHNIYHMGLQPLRSKLTIIPQDPVLFSGTLRFNLDPFNQHSDKDVWMALKLSHLDSFVSTLPQGLHYAIAEGGSNLSVGQKQLVCLARALLRKTKILIMDEATAAVDLETDDLIQNTIRSEFTDCTVLTIAHRLNTIMDNNRVMVMDKGKIVEFDAPAKLLEHEETIFYGMAKEAGLITENTITPQIVEGKRLTVQDIFKSKSSSSSNSKSNLNLEPEIKNDSEVQESPMDKVLKGITIENPDFDQVDGSIKKQESMKSLDDPEGYDTAEEDKRSRSSTPPPPSPIEEQDNMSDS